MFIGIDIEKDLLYTTTWEKIMEQCVLNDPTFIFIIYIYGCMFWSLVLHKIAVYAGYFL